MYTRREEKRRGMMTSRSISSSDRTGSTIRRVGGSPRTGIGSTAVTCGTARRLRSGLPAAT